MEQPDPTFTERLQHWLQTPPAERDLQEGIEMFHRLRPTERILYRNFLNRPQTYAAKLEYHLRKHLQIRLDGLTARRVALMDEEVTASVQRRMAARFHGRRPDHDRLPEDIRELYDANGVTFEKMKTVYNELLTMEDRPSCERYELLKVLQAEDRLYCQRWEQYDSYLLSPEPDAPAENPDGDTEGTLPEEAGTVEAAIPEPADAAAFARELAAARKFISDNLARLEGDGLDEKRRLDILDRTQERIGFVQSAGGTFKPDYADRLRAAGLQPATPCPMP